jgi:hypothetical protein
VVLSSVFLALCSSAVSKDDTFFSQVRSPAKFLRVRLLGGTLLGGFVFTLSCGGLVSGLHSGVPFWGQNSRFLGCHFLAASSTGSACPVAMPRGILYDNFRPPQFTSFDCWELHLSGINITGACSSAVSIAGSFFL